MGQKDVYGRLLRARWPITAQSTGLGGDPSGLRRPGALHLLPELAATDCDIEERADAPNYANYHP